MLTDQKTSMAFKSQIVRRTSFISSYWRDRLPWSLAFETLAPKLCLYHHLHLQTDHKAGVLQTLLPLHFTQLLWASWSLTDIYEVCQNPCPMRTRSVIKDLQSYHNRSHRTTQPPAVRRQRANSPLQLHSRSHSRLHLRYRSPRNLSPPQ